MQRAIEIRSAGRSERGPRPRNEDAFLCRDFEDVAIIAVADGLGGMVGGGIASARAIERVNGSTEEIVSSARSGRGGAAAILGSLMRDIDADLRRIGSEDPILAGLGTTLTVAAVGCDRVAFAHVGDSRLYALFGGDAARSFRLLTEDMNLAARLVREGKLSRDAYARSSHRSRLLQFLGKSGSLRPQVGELEFEQECRSTGGVSVVIASDGLVGPVGEDEIAGTMRECLRSDDLASGLVRLAIERNATDNVTVVATTVRARIQESPGGEFCRPQQDLEECGSAGSD